jgi:hypothetical protein
MNDRLRELARAEALNKHAHYCLVADLHGHVQGMNDTEWGFSVCPHPDCVLVRASVAAPPQDELVSPSPAGGREAMKGRGRLEHCSFCGRSGLTAQWLIASPLALICSNCILVCVEILLQRDGMIDTKRRKYTWTVSELEPEPVKEPTTP